MLHELDQERNVHLHAADAEFLQAALHPTRRIDEAATARRHLHQQRVVIRRDDGAREGGPRVEPDAHAGSRTVGGDAAVIRHEIVGGVFRRDPTLDGISSGLHRVLRGQADLRIGERKSLGDEDLGFDDIGARDLFGHRVLDLDSRIDLDEVEIAGVGVDQEFDCARVFVSQLPSDGQGGVADFFARVRIERGGGGDLHDFLMAALDRAIALVEVHEISVQVAHQLNFDVPGTGHVFFKKDVRRPEGDLRLALGLFEGGGEFAGRPHDAHPATAASLGRLDHHREAHLLRGLLPRGGALQRLAATRKNGHADPLGHGAGSDLVAELLQKFGPRTDEDDAVCDAGPGQLGVFREESIAGMNRVDLPLLGQRDDRVDIEVRPDGLARLPDRIGFVSLESVQGKPVLVRVDRDGADAQLVSGPEDADRDLAAISDQKTGDAPHGAFSSGRRPSAANWEICWTSAKEIRGEIARPPRIGDVKSPTFTDRKASSKVRGRGMGRSFRSALTCRAELTNLP